MHLCYFPLRSLITTKWTFGPLITARVTWIKEGDQNTTYFHKIVNNRRSQNQINSLKIGINDIKNQKTIQDHIDNHFKNIPGQEGEYTGRLKSSICDEEDSLQDLDDEITKKETKEEIKGLAQEKTSGLY